MGLNQHTIIFVPNSRAKFRKWRISQRAIRIFCAALAVTTLGVSYVSWKYLTTEVDLAHLEELRIENLTLVELNGELDRKLGELESQLAQFEEQTNNLAILAGVERLESSAASTVARGAGGAGGSFTGATPDLAIVDDRTRLLSQQLDLIGGRLHENQLLIDSTPSIPPVDGIRTSRYGYRKDPITGRRAFHGGIDIAATPDKKVLAAADGIVVKAGRMQSLGRTVVISHGHSELVTRYAHLSEIYVEVGQEISRYDSIGRVGNSGRATGYHLHYEILKGRKALDPSTFIYPSRTRQLP